MEEYHPWTVLGLHPSVASWRSADGEGGGGVLKVTQALLQSGKGDNRTQPFVPNS